MDNMCCCGVCSKCWAGKYIVVGLILIINQLYIKWDIWVVLGVLIALKGIMKLVMPTCGHCKTDMPMKKSKK